MPFCPDKKIVQTKKLSRQKNRQDKKIVRTKNCPDKKIVRAKNCPEKKIVRTKKLSGQKNCPDKKNSCTLFLSELSMPSFFVFFIFCPSSLQFVVLNNFCPYFRPIVQQKHGTYFRNIFKFFGIITTCLTKLLSKVPNIPLKFLLKYGRDCVLKVIQHRLTQ